MKFLVFGILFLGFSGSILSHPENYEGLEANVLGGIADIINNLIKQALEGLRKAIPDPIQIPLVNLTFPDEGMLTGHYEMVGFQEDGLEKFNITTVDAHLLSSKLTIILDVPTNINFNGDYKGDLTAGTIIPLYGGGHFSAFVQGLKLNLSSHFVFKLKNKSLKLSNTTVIVTAKRSEFNIHGMIDNEGFSLLISQIFTDTFTPFLNNHTRLLSKILSPLAESAINAIFKGKDKTTLAPTTTTTPAPTPKPSPAPTQEPSSAPTPEPSPAPTPEPSPASTPEPSPASTPEPSPIPADAFDDINLENLLSEINDDDLKELQSSFFRALVSHPKLFEIFNSRSENRKNV